MCSKRTGNCVCRHNRQRAIKSTQEKVVLLCPHRPRQPLAVMVKSEVKPRAGEGCEGREGCEEQLCTLCFQLRG